MHLSIKSSFLNIKNTLKIHYRCGILYVYVHAVQATCAECHLYMN